MEEHNVKGNNLLAEADAMVNTPQVRKRGTSKNVDVRPDLGYWVDIILWQDPTLV